MADTVEKGTEGLYISSAHPNVRAVDQLKKQSFKTLRIFPATRWCSRATLSSNDSIHYTQTLRPLLDRSLD